MKKHPLVLYLILASFLSFAATEGENPIRIDPDVYLIKYPEQSIKIFFNKLPSEELDKVMSDIFLTEQEKYQIAIVLKSQIDTYPPQFISRYLDIDIYPLIIKNKTEFGLNVGKNMIVEVSKIKQGMTFKNSIKSALAHQIGHLLESMPETGLKVENYKEFLSTTQLTNPYDKSKYLYSALEQGYVSRYASGEIQGNYSASEEFAEIFAYMTCPDNRNDVLEFTNNNPNNILSSKISRFMVFLDESVYGTQTDLPYYFTESGHALSAPYSLEEDNILLAHELRSYATLDFDAMNQKELAEETPEIVLEPTTPDYDDYAEPATDISPYYSFGTFPSYDPVPDTNYRNPASKQTKDKKKKKGWIWAAVLIALAVLSE